MNFCLKQGNSLDVLKTLPDKSVQCCVTSPPYFNLRDYQTGRWEGGDPSCPHARLGKCSPKCNTGQKNPGMLSGDGIYKSICPKCGAKRIDQQIGLEETPSEYVSKMVEVFREVRRVLKDDGTFWLNIGDTYSTHGSGSKKHPHNFKTAEVASDNGIGTLKKSSPSTLGLPEKSLLGVPWKLAFALQDDGWLLRQDIIFAKNNCLPESTKDRFTRSHEYIFLLTKQGKYYFDHKAVMEEAAYDGRKDTILKKSGKYENGEFLPNVNAHSFHAKGHERWPNVINGVRMRNKRSVWNINTAQFKGSHFAVMPWKLADTCILAGSKEGDWVLDPFSGAATTGIAAFGRLRNYIGIELNPKFLEMSRNRLITADPIFSKEVEDIEIK